jgi:hypothetical protein
MKQETLRSKGVARRLGVLDEFQIISFKRLTTVRRFAWPCYLLDRHVSPVL